MFLIWFDLASSIISGGTTLSSLCPIFGSQKISAEEAYRPI